MKELEHRLLDLEKRIEQLEAPVRGVQSSILGAKKLSPKEFLLTCSPPNDVQRTLVVAYFLEKFEGLTSFNIKDLEVAFERAKEKKPANMNDKVNLNIRNGHMAEATDKKDNLKAWYLTNTGERQVEASEKKEN